MSEAIHELHEVVDPARKPPGELRRAAAQEYALLVDWERAFVREARLEPGAEGQAEHTVKRRLDAGSQFVWHDGAPVCTLAHAPQVAGSVRIGPVYTPPEHRCKGYASAAVATLSRRVLRTGARRCALFTDLANPTSNKIYAAVGYRRVADWEEWELTP